MNIIKFLTNNIKSYLNIKRDKGVPEYGQKFEECKYDIKKIAFYVGCADNRSDRYRVYNIVEGLRRRRIQVDIYKSNSLNYLFNDVNYDLLIIFREDRYGLLNFKKLGKHMKNLGIPMIYDTDDYTIEYENERSTKNIKKIIELSEAVTVTTEFLANKYREAVRKKVYVLKNTINYEQMYIAQRINKITEKNKVKIVYQSGTPTHNADFEIVQKVILDILKSYSCVEFHIFGPLELIDKFEAFDSQIVRHSYVDYRLLQMQVSSMDINIAPLVINDFNHCKSELKIFEAALMKIPTVCSRTDSYSRVVKNGINGFIADDEIHWKKSLLQLIEDESLRKNIGEKAFEDFVPLFYIENNIEQLISFYKEIV